MTNQELIGAIHMLIACYEQMEDSHLRTMVQIRAHRLLDELRDRAVGITKRGQE